MALNTNTRVALLRDIALLMEGAGDHNPLRTTTTLGSTSTVTDTALASADADTDVLGSPWIRIDSLVANGPVSGEISRVRTNGLTVASGVLTVSPVFSAAVQALTDFSIWRAINPNIALGLMNRALRSMRYKSVTPISVLTNPDFELVTAGSGVDSWTYANATVTTTNGYSSTAGNVRHGTYAARLQGNAGIPRIQSNTVPAMASQKWMLSASGFAATGTASLTLFDVTTSATVVGMTAVSHAQKAYQLMLAGVVTIPTGTKQIAVRLAGTGATDDIFWDDAALWPLAQWDYELPSWIDDPKDIESIGYYARGTNYGDSNCYALDEGLWRPWPQQPREYVEETGAHALRVQIPPTASANGPLYMWAWRPFSELTSDAATTTCDRMLLCYETLRLIYQALNETAAREGNKDMAALWAAKQAEAGASANKRRSAIRYGDQPRKVQATQMAAYRGGGL